MHYFKQIALLILLFNVLPLQAGDKAVPVKVAPVLRAPLQQQLSLPGEVVSQRISLLSSQVDGMVWEVSVEEGQHVEKGELLLRLDDDLARFELQRAIAALQEAEAQWRESKRQRGEFSKLVGKSFIANTSYESAEAKVRINAAAVKRAQAEKERYQALLARHEIKAPFSGVISEKNVEAGQWVKVGDGILTLVDDGNLRVEAWTPQRYFPLLSRETEVEIQPDDVLPAKTVTARLSHIIPVANADSHYFPVHIDLSRQQLNLTPGMSVRVKLKLTGAGSQSALLVPRDALIKKADNADSVWVLEQKPQGLYVQEVPVTVGQISNNQVEIIAPSLTEDDRVVVRGNEILKPGQAVRVIP